MQSWVYWQVTPLVLREFDHLITVDKIENDRDEGWEESITKNTQFDTEALGDPNLRALKRGQQSVSLSLSSLHLKE